MARRKANEQGDEPVNPGEQQATPAEGQAAGAGDAPTPLRPARAPGSHDFALGRTPK